ncbi:MAG: glycosyltransferase family 4 protein [Anaerolineae bacterium]|nr:glycosyltransferase family 4 protein [Anaerolineae bacterium]
MKVALVAKPAARMTGLLRYALSLIAPLETHGIETNLVHPRVPALASRAGRLLGLDAQAFFTSYPLAVDAGDAALCHLASQTLATLLWARRLPPVVVTVHDIIPYLVRHDPALSTYRHTADRGFDRLALRALRRARALIAISAYTKQTLIEALDYPEAHIHVVHRAVDREVFKPLTVTGTFKQQYGLRKDERYVLYVGSEDPRKNLATLIEAFARVSRQLPQARLLKAGAPHFEAERKRLEQQVAHLNLEDRVRFLEHVPDEDLPLLYNAVDVFVLPSFYEGFGLPALEAMSCGTPLVAANRASLPEVVGQGGALVAPDDPEAMAEALHPLLEDPAHQAAAREAALAQAARFSLERQAAETLAVYEEVV